MSLVVYPNPSNGNRVTISIPGLELEEEVNINIYDMSGKLVFTKRVSAPDGTDLLTITNASFFSTGMYMINAVVGNKIYQHRLVINK